MNRAIQSFFFLFCLLVIKNSRAQNVGIGVANPQQKLHVGGNIRVDGMAGASNGLITVNNAGDLLKVNFSGNPNEVLKGDGSFGSVPSGSLPSGAIVGSNNKADSNLLNAGFSYFGQLPTIFMTYKQYPGGVSTQYLQLPMYENGKSGQMDAPVGRTNASGVWTGTEMLVWGGYYYSADSGYVFLNDGGKYSPQSDTWASISSINAPRKRGYASSVWTGTEMLIWGGYDSVHAGLTQSYIGFTNTGGRYNPATNTWNSMSQMNAPAARAGAAAVWTGSLMVVWGGIRDTGNLNNGSRYNPVTNSWSSMSTLNAPLSDGVESRLFFDPNTGYVLALGYSNSCGRYNPATNSWLAMAPVPTSYNKQNAVWTGSQLWVFGNDNKIHKYSPNTNTWTTTALAVAPANNFSTLKSGWTGFEMLLYGYTFGSDYTAVKNRFARYDPVANHFIYTDEQFNQLVDHGCVFVSAGSMAIKWGGVNNTSINSVRAYRFSSEGNRYYFNAGIAFPPVTVKSGDNNVLHLFRKN